jgi:thiamine kinase-like enzyme
MSVEIEQVIAAVPDWTGRYVTAEEIVGGLTNRNYRVEVDGEPVFVRVPGADTDLLAVDRRNELANSLAAAGAGVGPRPAHLPAWDVMVLEWLPGPTLSNELCLEPGMPERIADVLRRLHAGPRFRDEFDMFRLSERYLHVVDERLIRIPAGYREHMALLPRIEAALAARPISTVPCHNDLLAANYLDDGERVWIVDYEYSGNNDPTFELGNTCQELGWDDARVEALCAAYFGQATDALLARMRLQMIMSDVGWTLWAAIQAAVSHRRDFWGWPRSAGRAARPWMARLRRWFASGLRRTWDGRSGPGDGRAAWTRTPGHASRVGPDGRSHHSGGTPNA